MALSLVLKSGVALLAALRTCRRQAALVNLQAAAGGVAAVVAAGTVEP